MKKISLLGVRIDCVTREELFEILESGKKAKIAKVNSEFLLRALKNNEFKDTLNSFDLNIADGSGILWAASYLRLPITKFQFLKPIQAIWQMIWTGASLVFYPKYCKTPIPERFPGVEALKLMLNAAQDSGLPVYFLGAEEEISKKATEVLKREFPKLIVAGRHHGYFQDDMKIIEEINKSKAGLLIVALGSPKQEYWIHDNMSKLTTVRIAVGEGGSFDRVVGAFKIAPRWMRQVGIEWLWRTFSDRSKTPTGNRAKRVWNAVPVFIYNVVKYKISNN